MRLAAACAGATAAGLQVELYRHCMAGVSLFLPIQATHGAVTRRFITVPAVDLGRTCPSVTARVQCSG